MTIANREQAEHWNNSDEVGHWITQQTRYDGQLSVFVEMLIDGASLHAGDRVLDVGCGCGATTHAAARIVAPGTAVGIDLSGPMLECARTDAAAAGLANASFEQGDVHVHAFDRDAFDAVISRFGIMFFDDPVAAFTNLHNATRSDGRLAFVCWQPLTENEWLLVPGAAIAEHLPLPEGGDPNAPGMFAFADPARVKQVLTDACWHDITVTSKHTPMLIGGGGTVDDTVEFLRTGSIGRTLLAGAEPEVAERALRAVRAALEERANDRGVELDAAVWLVQARA
jgi:SAM-dependent methyltransferase